VLNVKTRKSLLGRSQIEAVETSMGLLRTETVFNCTGVWANLFCKKVQMKEFD